MKASKFSDAEGVHPEGGQRPGCGGGDLPQSRDQPGGLGQWEEVGRSAAVRDAPAEAARGGERQAEEAGHRSRGAMARSRPGASIVNWAWKERPSSGSRPSSATSAGRRHDRTRPAQCISSTISWRRAISCACSRSSVSSPASHRCCSHGSASAAAMSCDPGTGLQGSGISGAAR